MHLTLKVGVDALLKIDVVRDALGCNACSLTLLIDIDHIVATNSTATRRDLHHKFEIVSFRCGKACGVLRAYNLETCIKLIQR